MNLKKLASELTHVPESAIVGARLVGVLEVEMANGQKMTFDAVGLARRNVMLTISAGPTPPVVALGDEEPFRPGGVPEIIQRAGKSGGRR